MPLLNNEHEHSRAIEATKPYPKPSQLWAKIVELLKAPALRQKHFEHVLVDIRNTCRKHYNNAFYAEVPDKYSVAAGYFDKLNRNLDEEKWSTLAQKQRRTLLFEYFILTCMYDEPHHLDFTRAESLKTSCTKTLTSY